MCLLLSKFSNNHEICLESVAARSVLSAKAVGLYLRDKIRSWCPPCRLVGIELNPGPNHKNKNKKNTSVVLFSPSKEVVVKTTPPKKKRNRKRKSKGLSSLGSSSNIGANLTKGYFDSLVDPWDNAGVKLGWGTMVTTSITTSYNRGSFTSNADGSCALALMPQNYDPLIYWNGGSAVASTGLIGSADQTVLSSQWGAGRVISMGIRAFPDIAATAAPGVVYTGTLQNVYPAQVLANMTVNDFLTFPNTHMGRGYSGASATGRPIDSTSFQFNEAICNLVGLPATINAPFSIPYVAFVGLPASSVVYYEFIVNIEATPIDVHGFAAAMGIGTSTDEPTLSGFWPSVERLWSNIAPLLPSSGLIGELAAQGATSMLNSIVHRNNKSRRSRSQISNVDAPLLSLCE